MRNTDINREEIMAELEDLQHRLRELEQIEAEYRRIEELTAAAYGLTSTTLHTRGSAPLPSISFNH